MRLTDADAARFYSIWRPLLAWVNDERKIVANLSPNADGAIYAEDAAKIREVLWKDELYSAFDEILPMAPPLMVDATLLPFEGAIVHDGLLRSYNVFLGAGIRRSLLEQYRDATARGAVHKTMPDQDPRAARRLRRQPDLARTTAR